MFSTPLNVALKSAEINWLAQHCRGFARFQEPLWRHTTFRVGGPADAYIEPPHLKSLSAILEWLLKNGIPYRVIGAGSNLLVKDNGVHGVVISLKRCYQARIEVFKQRSYALINVAAGVHLQTVCWFAIRHGLKGLNFALGIPGAIGGAIMMNAGANGGAMRDVLESITILHPFLKEDEPLQTSIPDNSSDDSREPDAASPHASPERFPGDAKIEKINVPKHQLKIRYRQLTSFGALNQRSRRPLQQSVYNKTRRPIIVQACIRLDYENPLNLRQEAIEILKRRMRKQPVRAFSAGCFFKNPTFADADKKQTRSAGALIEQTGLKGKRIGGAQISSRHANFIINRRSASAKDILSLKDLIQTTVFNRFGVTLEPEVEIIG